MIKFLLTENARNWQTGFQTPASPVMEGILNFHHDLFFFFFAICCFVFYMLIRTMFLFNSESNKKPEIVIHAPVLEIIWTLIPSIILVFVAIPSFSLLYSMDEIIEPLFTIKVIGHQWYWSYEFLDPSIIFNTFLWRFEPDANPQEEWGNYFEDASYEFDSFMIPTDSLKKNQLRLLDVDNKVFLPIETNIRVLITAADVLHSWAVPALGVKLDACPGRLNQTSLYIKRPGTFYGQCSEICGVNHGFMPIAIKGIDILGNGSKITAHTAEAILPIFSILLGHYYSHGPVTNN